jgi:hypothetical protein
MIRFEFVWLDDKTHCVAKKQRRRPRKGFSRSSTSNSRNIEAQNKSFSNVNLPVVRLDFRAKNSNRIRENGQVTSES